jgi:hypothetical protein
MTGGFRFFGFELDLPIVLDWRVVSIGLFRKKAPDADIIRLENEN